MKKLLIIVYSIIFSFFVSCNNKHTIEEMNNLIIGQWYITVNKGGYNGIEIYNFAKDNDFTLKGNLHFEGDDSGFKFSIPLTFSINGKWDINSRNCLKLKFSITSLIIDTDLQLFEVTASNEGADNTMLSVIKEEMGNTLENFIHEDLKNIFGVFRSSEIEVGKIINMSDNSIHLERDGGNIILKKI